MNYLEFKAAIELHVKWLKNEDGGKKLEFHGKVEMEFRADLSRADLLGADLSWANLSGANLDYSALPLQCGTLLIKADIRLAAQWSYHFCRMDFGDCKEAKAAQKACKKLANKFHRANECGRIK